MSEPSAKALSAADILRASDCEVRGVEVPEWGGVVNIRVLSAGDGLELSERMAALPKERQHEGVYMLLGACLCDADGARLFADDATAKAALSRRNLRVLGRLQDEALELQGWKRGKADPGKAASAEAAPGASPTA